MKINQSINKASLDVLNESTKASWRHGLGLDQLRRIRLDPIFTGCDDQFCEEILVPRALGGTLILVPNDIVVASVRSYRAFFDMPFLTTPYVFHTCPNHSHTTFPTKQQAGDAPTVRRSIPSHPASASGARFCRSQRGMSEEFDVGLDRSNSRSRTRSM